MSSESRERLQVRLNSPDAHRATLAITAYHAALDEFTVCRKSRELLLERLGDVDQQAAHPLADTRLAVAGRLIAAAQVSERVQLPEFQVHGVIRAWLTHRTAERDDAAPTLAPRIAPEDEHVFGLTQRLIDAESRGGFSRAAWGAAGMILQRLIRPTIEVSRALALRAMLNPLAAAAVRLSDEPPPADVAAAAASRRLTASVIRLRADGRIVTDQAAGCRQRHDAWLRIAGAAARAHAQWAEAPLAGSMGQALTRATERLAGSLVPDDPERFDHETALEHAVQAAFDAAVTALGLTARPPDPAFVCCTPDVLEPLMEAASSGLIGAWVIDHTPSIRDDC
jgi:hypothetical protein